MGLETQQAKGQERMERLPQDMSHPGPHWGGEELGSGMLTPDRPGSSSRGLSRCLLEERVTGNGISGSTWEDETGRWGRQRQGSGPAPGTGSGTRIRRKPQQRCRSSCPAMCNASRGRGQLACALGALECRPAGRLAGCSGGCM